MNFIDFKAIEEVGSNILESVNPLLVLRCAKNAVREKNWVIPMRWDRGKINFKCM
jgi:hypothetical protein